MYLEALDNLDRLGDVPGRANALNGLAAAHLHARSFHRALDAALKALDLYESLGDDTGTAGTASLLGQACHALGTPDEAKRYYRSGRGAPQAGDPTAPPGREPELRGQVVPTTIGTNARLRTGHATAISGDHRAGRQPHVSCIRIGARDRAAKSSSWAPAGRRSTVPLAAVTAT
ncbi:MAG: tetratricopeptide repeat protein [Saccharothrix sp.]|nr:tetratricopeptide repeat protein [Saccharothrix sp.]